MGFIPSDDDDPSAVAKSIWAGSFTAPRHPDENIAAALQTGADKLGVDPVDYGTAISYESARTFNPWVKGPVTKWGQHRGTIQYGEPQQKQYGVHEGQTFEDQVTNSNVRYLQDKGVRPGMGFEQIYKAINGGKVNARSGTHDADTGRTIADNIRIAQGSHRKEVENRFGGYFFNPNKIAKGFWDNPDVTGQHTENDDFDPNGIATDVWNTETPAPESDQPYTVNPNNPLGNNGKPMISPVDAAKGVVSSTVTPTFPTSAAQGQLPTITQPPLDAQPEQLAPVQPTEHPVAVPDGVQPTATEIPPVTSPPDKVYVITDTQGQSYGPVDDQTGLKPDEVRVMPTGENKSGKYLIAQKVVSKDGKEGYRLVPETPDQVETREETKQSIQAPGALKLDPAQKATKRFTVNNDVDYDDPAVKQALADQAAQVGDADYGDAVQSQLRERAGLGPIVRTPRQEGKYHENLNTIARAVSSGKATRKEAFVDALVHSGYEITPQEAEKYYGTGAGINIAEKDWQPGGNVEITFGNIAEIKGKDYAIASMRQEQLDNELPDLRNPRMYFYNEKSDAEYLRNTFGNDAATGIAAFINVGGTSSTLLAGAVRSIAEGVGADAENSSLYNFLKEAGEATTRLHDEAGRKYVDENGVVQDDWSTWFEKGSIGIIGDLARLYLGGRVLGGGVAVGRLGQVAKGATLFGAQSGLLTAGTGAPWSDVGKQTVKGAAIGGVSFGLATTVSSAMEALTGTALNRALPALFKPGVEIAHIAGTTYTIAKIAGDKTSDALHESLVNSLFHLGPIVIGKTVAFVAKTGKVIKLKREANRVVVADQDAKPDVTINMPPDPETLSTGVANPNNPIYKTKQKTEQKFTDKKGNVYTEIPGESKRENGQILVKNEKGSAVLRTAKKLTPIDAPIDAAVEPPKVAEAPVETPVKVETPVEPQIKGDITLEEKAAIKAQKAQERIEAEKVQNDAPVAQEKSSEVDAAATGMEPPRTVTHTDPAIDGKPVVAETGDGRVVVPNENNVSGVSIVKDQGQLQKKGISDDRMPEPPVYTPEATAEYKNETQSPKDAQKQRLLDSEPITIRTDKFDLSQPLKSLKKTAKNIYASFRGHTVTTTDGRKVEFTTTGLKETLQHIADQRTLQVIPQLPQLIEKALPLWSDAAQDRSKPNILAFHNYGIKTEINGKETFTRITVREDNDGHLYYDNHSTSSNELLKAPSQQPYPKANRGEAVSELSRDRLHQWWHDVNENSLQTDKKGSDLLPKPKVSTPEATLPDDRSGGQMENPSTLTPEATPAYGKDTSGQQENQPKSSNVNKGSTETGPESPQTRTMDGVKKPQPQPDKFNDVTGKPIAETPKPKSVPAPEPTSEQQPKGKPSKVALDIEAKTVADDLTKSFEGIAGYDPVTVKDQAKKAVDIVHNDLELAKRIIAGEEKVPDGLLAAPLIDAMERYARKNNDVELLRDLARSPLTSETSRHAQELRLLRERHPNSPIKLIHEIEVLRESAASRRGTIPKDIDRQIQHVTAKLAAKNKLLEAHLQDREMQIAEMQTQATLKDLQISATAPAVLRVAEQIVSKLETRAEAARTRLQKRGNVFTSGLDPVALKDLAEIGAAHIGRAGVDFAQWSGKMIDEFGEKARPHLEEIYKAANRLIDRMGDGSRIKPIKEGGIDAVSLSAVKTRLQKQIEALEFHINHHEKIVRNPKKQLAYDKQAIELKERRDELKNQYEEIFGKPGLTDEQRLNTWKTRTANRIAELKEKIEKGDYPPNPKRPPVALDEKGRELQVQRDNLQRRIEDLRSIKGEIAPEEVKQINDLANTVDETQAAMEKGGDRLNYGRAVVELNNYVGDLKQKAKKTTFADVKARPLQNIVKGTIAAPGLFKAIQASFDNSAIFRQGWKTLWTHPNTWRKNAVKTFADIYKTFGGKNVMNELNADIVSRPTYEQMKKAKLNVATMEEDYPSTLPERIPFIRRAYKASQDAYTGFVHKTRADVFDKYLQIAEKNGVELNDQELTNIGRMVNSLTGRGHLGNLDGKGADALNVLFFAPRNLKSHIDVLGGHMLTGGASISEMIGENMGSNFVRKEAAKNTVKIIVGTGAVLGIAKAICPDCVDFDPRSANFGKIKIGNTRIDVTGGMGSILILAARLASRTSKSSITGKISPINAKDKTFGARTGLDLIEDFFENKLSPTAGEVKNWLSGETFDHKPFTWTGAAGRLVTPLPIKNTQELLNDPKAAPVLVGLLADALGASTNTYGETLPPTLKDRGATQEDFIENSKADADKYIKQIKAEKASGADAALLENRLQEKIEDLLEKDKLTPEMANQVNEVLNLTGDKAYLPNVQEDAEPDDDNKPGEKKFEDDRSFIGRIKTYADAIGVDPVDAFNKWYSGQTIKKTVNGTIIVDRMSKDESQAVKKKRLAGEDMILDHTVSLQLGGTNEESNLILVPYAEWARYTPVENAIGTALRAKKISGIDARELLKKFKAKEIGEADIEKTLDVKLVAPQSAPNTSSKSSSLKLQMPRLPKIR